MTHTHIHTHTHTHTHVLHIKTGYDGMNINSQLQAGFSLTTEADAPTLAKKKKEKKNITPERCPLQSQ